MTYGCDSHLLSELWFLFLAKTPVSLSDRLTMGFFIFEHIGFVIVPSTALSTLDFHVESTNNIMTYLSYCLLANWWTIVLSLFALITVDSRLGETIMLCVHAWASVGLVLSPSSTFVWNTLGLWIEAYSTQYLRNKKMNQFRFSSVNHIFKNLKKKWVALGPCFSLIGLGLLIWCF